jgi:hypothetical protein
MDIGIGGGSEFVLSEITSGSSEEFCILNGGQPTVASAAEQAAHSHGRVAVIDIKRNSQGAISSPAF